MGKPKTRLRFSAIDHLDPYLIAPGEIDAKSALRDLSESSVPFASALASNGEPGFVELVLRAFISAGLADAEAEAATLAVLTDPSVSLLSGKRVLQSLVLAAREGSEAMADALRVTVTGTLNKQAWSVGVDDVAVVIEPFDLSDNRELARVAVRVAADLASYPMPSTTVPRAFVVVALGNPIAGGARVDENAPSWNSILERLGEVLGVTVRIVTNQTEINDKFPASTRLTVAFDPSFIGKARSVGQVPEATQVEVLDRPSFEVLVDVAEMVLAELSELEASETSADQQVTLKAGDKLFFRKLESSASFDKFNATKPCSHDNGWVRYTKAPKATKGMRRLFENFEDDMLHHCGKGYKCGVYAVFVPLSF